VIELRGGAGRMRKRMARLRRTACAVHFTGDTGEKGGRMRALLGVSGWQGLR
jgi:hypothetical protein